MVATCSRRDASVTRMTVNICLITQSGRETNKLNTDIFGTLGPPLRTAMPDPPCTAVEAVSGFVEQQWSQVLQHDFFGKRLLHALLGAYDSYVMFSLFGKYCMGLAS